ncbi:hypothetical protein [Rhodococcus sp. X156]|uniref:hypothetical protein n=1 Tax=Rhodococcus sp. X156 TaxID=2499145 RepID=UPI000FDC27C5|nr:hypothetical protein [Rhodococcus sp. X156]
MSAPSVDEVKALVASPGLSDQAKRDLLQSYLAAAPGSDDDELYAAADRLGAALLPGHLSVVEAKQLSERVAQAHREVQSQQGRQALEGARLGAAGSNDILDQGAPGLRYFEHFAPLYQRCISGSDISRDKAVQLYDEQRDIDLATLRADAATMTSGADRLGVELARQRAAWDAVSSIWTGRGGVAADAFVRTYLTEADSARGRTADLAAALGPAADGIEECVRVRASAVAELYAATVGGKTPSQIDEIISFAKDRHSVTSAPQAGRILQMFGGDVGPTGDEVGAVANTGLRLSSGAGLLSVAQALAGQTEAYLQRLVDQAVQCSRDFVTTVFIPDVESRWRLLTEVCASTDTAVRDLYRSVTAVAGAAEGHPFSGTPGALPALPGPGVTGPAAPGSHSPVAPSGTGGPDGFVGGGRTSSDADGWGQTMGSTQWAVGTRAAMPADGLLSLGESGAADAVRPAGTGTSAEGTQVGGVSSTGGALDATANPAAPPEDEVGQVRAAGAGSGGGAAEGASAGGPADVPARTDAGTGAVAASGGSGTGVDSVAAEWVGASAPMAALHRQDELTPAISGDQWIVENQRDEGAWTSVGSALTPGTAASAGSDPTRDRGEAGQEHS